MQILDEVIAEIAGRYYDDLAPAIDRVWKDGIASIRADLREWLRRASEDRSGYAPIYFEMSFGLKGRRKGRLADHHSVNDPVQLDCGIQLRGSIDLVEHHPTGLLRVTDHKTGKAGRGSLIVDGGKALQPVFYALAAEKLLKEKGKVECGRLYFCTSTGGFAEQVVLLEKRAREAAQDIAAIIGAAIREPFLPAAPATGECEWCDCQMVCGPYEELRTARKPEEKLDDLKELRSLP